MAFLVKVDGLVICHNGDYRMDYQADFPYLQQHASGVDLAFVPGVSDEKFQYALQNRDFFERFHPKAVFPMHAEAGARMYQDFAAVFRARPGIAVPRRGPCTGHRARRRSPANTASTESALDARS